MENNKRNNKKRAGKLQSEASICLHCAASLALWYGKQGKTPGVTSFFSKAAVLELAASNDDPYADYALLNIERVLNEAFVKLEALNEPLMAMAGMHPRSRIQSGMCFSKEPLVFPLRISNPFSWRMVALLERYDLLLVDVLDAGFKARITRTQSERLQKEASHIMRQVIDVAIKSQHSGITRNDIAAKNAKARQAEELFGLLPLEVAEGLTRAEFAPEIKVQQYL